MHRELGKPDDFPPFPVCVDCGNQVNDHGRYIARCRRIVLEEREDDEPDRLLGPDRTCNQ